MKSVMSKRFLPVLPLLMLFLYLQLDLQPAASLPQTPTSGIVPKWSAPLSVHTCLDADLMAFCQHSSPLLADLTGDGISEIVVGTNAGHIMVFMGSGVLLWDRDISGAFGMAANSEEITSSPAIGDVDNDGQLDIVVGVGTIDSRICTQGG